MAFVEEQCSKAVLLGLVAFVGRVGYGAMGRIWRSLASARVSFHGGPELQDGWSACMKLCYDTLIHERDSELRTQVYTDKSSVVLQPGGSGCSSL